MEERRIRTWVQHDEPRRIARFAIELDTGKLEPQRFAFGARDELQTHAARFLLLHATHDEQLALRVSVHHAAFAGRGFQHSLLAVAFEQQRAGRVAQ